MVSEALKLEREKRRTVREERLTNVLMDPQMLGLLTLLGGLYVAQRIPYSEDEVQNNTLKAIATSGVVLASLSRAGLGGWPALAAAGIAGAATTEGVGTLDPLAKAVGARSIWSMIFGGGS
jgi:hypothetical protein